jgi:hypothetical protein
METSITIAIKARHKRATHLLLGRKQMATLEPGTTSIVGLLILPLAAEDAAYTATIPTAPATLQTVTSPGVTYLQALAAARACRPTALDSDWDHLAMLVLLGKAKPPAISKPAIRAFVQTLRRLGMDAKAMEPLILDANRRHRDASRYTGPALAEPDAPYAVPAPVKP